ncbi:lipocalin family protein [Enterobacter sp. CC120223-11]|uniref:lipocalin family protein n=1 Tax=Enterobacter sp. CC120223-11 TaxID=1378073 RepID=UPI000BCB78BC|nr:lipocalin family protein [Enterobacter sp. CC120223-11]SNY76904.1 apolipoprotein D and lipocalin family protein [Enterobacter sp. CC120223-11]
MKLWHVATGFTALIALAACRSPGLPEGIQPVHNFDAGRYLGKWYEIARFDYYFERGLNNVTAQYSMNDDGSIQVINRGYDPQKMKWKQSEGKAKFNGPEDVAALKVSFFGPFYAGYNVIAIDPDYKYALVAGQSRDYLWILSRTPDIPADIRVKYLEIARAHHFPVNKLIWVKQDNSAS